MRLNYYEFPATTKSDVLADHGCTPVDRTLDGVSVTTAKKLLLLPQQIHELKPRRKLEEHGRKKR